MKDNFEVVHVDSGSRDNPSDLMSLATHLENSFLCWNQADNHETESSCWSEVSETAMMIADRFPDLATDFHAFDSAIAVSLGDKADIRRRWPDLLAKVWRRIEESTTPTIPHDKRTKPMSKIEALNYIGWPAHAKDERAARDWLTAAIRDGEYRCEPLNAKSFVFHIDDFPADCRSEIRKS